jgi:DNA-directed RNA polymerase subunit omega
MAREPIAPREHDRLRVYPESLIKNPNRRRTRLEKNIMRDDYLQAALLVIDDPCILVNVISRRVKQLKRGNRPLVESLEKLSPEDTALREVAERKISYELATPEELARHR